MTWVVVCGYSNFLLNTLSFLSIKPLLDFPVRCPTRECNVTISNIWWSRKSLTNLAGNYSKFAWDKTDTDNLDAFSTNPSR